MIKLKTIIGLVQGIIIGFGATNQAMVVMWM
jgi:hypothetical protein